MSLVAARSLTSDVRLEGGHRGDPLGAPCPGGARRRWDAAAADAPTAPRRGAARRPVRRGTLTLFAALWLALGCASGVRAERSGTPFAADDPARLCDAAAAQASRESGVPLSVLRAITLTETGRQRDGGFKPWPWTVNMEGAGVWFDTPDEARAYVDRHHTRGARSYDVGCFQLNFRWHGQHFASIEQMFDPLSNARYAARFLSDLHAETGDWSRAAGAYHSRTREYADRYRARFDRIRARLDGAPPPAEAPLLVAAAPAGGDVPSEVARVNGFPLLHAAGAAPSALGSLVPLGAAGGRRLIEPADRAPIAGGDDAG